MLWKTFMAKYNEIIYGHALNTCIIIAKNNTLQSRCVKYCHNFILASVFTFIMYQKMKKLEMYQLRTNTTSVNSS